MIESHICYETLPFRFLTLQFSQARSFIDISIPSSILLLYLNCVPTCLLQSCHSSRPQWLEAEDWYRWIVGAELNRADNPLFSSSTDSLPSLTTTKSKSPVCTSSENFIFIYPIAYWLLTSSYTQYIQNQTPDFRPEIRSICMQPSPFQQMAAFILPRMLRPKILPIPLSSLLHLVYSFSNPCWLSLPICPESSHFLSLLPLSTQL